MSNWDGSQSVAMIAPPFPMWAVYDVGDEKEEPPVTDDLLFVPIVAVVLTNERDKDSRELFATVNYVEFMVEGFSSSDEWPGGRGTGNRIGHTTESEKDDLGRWLRLAASHRELTRRFSKKNS